MPSVYEMYQKNGGYRQTAERVLSIWAKAENHNLFSSRQIFNRRLTHNGENRIRHCRKYNFPDGCRLITVLDKETHVFLFLGSHSECDTWLERYRGTNLRNLLTEIEGNQRSAQKPTAVILDNKKHFPDSDLYKIKADAKIYADVLDYPSGIPDNESKNTSDVVSSSFLKNDCMKINNVINKISNNLKRHRTEEALLNINYLEDFLTFTSSKLKYIDRLIFINHTTYH